MDEVQLTWKMEYGMPGCDEDADTPLARSARQLFQDGKPFPNHCLCFYDDTIGGSAPLPSLRWFGVFVKGANPGNRIIFFPGFDTRKLDQIYCTHGNKEQNKAFDFDHITLEGDLASVVLHS